MKIRPLLATGEPIFGKSPGLRLIFIALMVFGCTAVFADQEKAKGEKSDKPKRPTATAPT